MRGVYPPMGSCKSDLKTALGFLTVVDHAQHGLFGGYLLLNKAGRPLEFHCTAPVKPNRAQQILYGPTLEAFLYGEQIAKTLLEHAKTEPLVVCTDREPVLAVREMISLPVVLVLPSDDTAAGSEAGSSESAGHAHNMGDSLSPKGVLPSGQRLLRLDAAHKNGPRLLTFQLGRNRLAVAERSAEDRPAVTQRLADLLPSFDLSEPFGRIREAIEEAQQAAR